jgi:hypothetical protein
MAANIVISRQGQGDDVTERVSEFSLDLSELTDPIGLVLSVGEQHYRAVGTRLGDNGAITITWRSRCVICGEAFEVATPRSQIREPTRRCPAHRRPGRPPAAVGK